MAVAFALEDHIAPAPSSALRDGERLVHLGRVGLRPLRDRPGTLRRQPGDERARGEGGSDEAGVLHPRSLARQP